MSSNDCLTIFKVVSLKRTTFLRSELFMLVEQAETALLDGKVLDGFRFEVRYSEMRELRGRLSIYIRKLYRSDALPELPTIVSASTDADVRQAMAIVEQIFDMICQRKYLIESPIFKTFMRHRRRLSLRAGSTSPSTSTPSEVLSQTMEPTSKYSSQPNVSPHDYMIEASALLIGARRHESEEHYAEAYDLYKLAIEALLEGARQDNDTANVKMVKQKIGVLLDAADRLHETHLAHGQSKPSVTSDGSEFAMAELQHLFSQLKICDISGKVVVLQDRQKKKMCVVKLLTKNYRPPITPDEALPTNLDSVMPTDIGRMVKLTTLHETDSSVLLMLEHIPGGPLFSHLAAVGQIAVDSYPQALAKNPTPLDPNSSVVRASRPGMDSIRRRWSLNLSSSDWTSSHRHRGGSTTQQPLDHVEENQSFQQVLSEANQSPPVNFSLSLDEPLPPRDEKLVISVDSAFTETSDEKPSQCVPPIADVRRWALQVLDVFEALHRYGFFWGDFNPSNVLYDTTDGGIKVTFVCRWPGVDRAPPNEDACRAGYVAPELLGPLGIPEPSIPCDYWSFGALLFHLLTGSPLGAHLHDGLVASDSSSGYLDAELDQIVKNNGFSAPASQLVLDLLRKNPAQRLTNPDRIRVHAFFIPR